MEREEDGRWAVRSRRVSGSDSNDEGDVSDDAVICNGYYMKSQVTEIPDTLFFSMFTLFLTSCYC